MKQSTNNNYTIILINKILRPDNMTASIGDVTARPCDGKVK